ncbi:MAG TPA: UPF0182 family protein [Gemmatimonadaceae bacterium]|nr:UPF0182 family protein [Gemmatimonadaceae bacterium]
MTSRRWLAFALIASGITLLAAREASQFYAGYRWYQALGALSVWRARLIALIVLRAAGGLAVGLFAFANFYAVRRSVVSLVLPRRVGNLDIGEEVSSRMLTGMTVLVALIVTLPLALALQDWTGLLLANAGRPFGESDPYFNADLGFFTYRLPFEQSLFIWATACVLCVLAVVVFLYILTPGLRLERGRLHISEYVRRHLAVLAGVLMLLLAWHFRLEMYGLLLQGSGPDGTFTALDHHVGIPGELVLAMVTLAAGFVVIWAGWTGQRRLMFTAVAGVLATGVVTRDIAPLIGSRFPDEPDPVLRERPYEATRAGYTRRAYGVDRVVIGDSADAYATLAAAAIGVPAWDALPLARAVEAESRLGRGARVGWRGGPDGIIGVVTSPEPPPDPGEAAPVGIAVRTVASAADDRGNPARVPEPGSEDDAIVLAPSIVLDSTSGYVVVSDSARHVKGVPLTSPIERLAEAVSVRNPRLWVQELPEPGPVLVTLRDVRDRVAALAPFFVQASRVEPLLLGDSLYWVIDLYSASSAYPLSQRLVIDGAVRSYFQHAATALVLSQTGEVWILPDPVLDPIAATWAGEFPRLFVDRASLPAAVLAALPPAADAARTQALAFGRFGPRANVGRPIHLPVVDGADSSLAAQWPVFALPGGGPTAIEIPMLDQGERVRGVLVSEGGPDHRTVWLPAAGASGPLWHNVLDRLAAADSAARAPNVSAVHGVVRAFMLGDHLAYMQPVYQWTPGAVPRLLHVVYLVGDSVRVAPTLRQASGVVIPPRGASPGSPVETRRLTARLYQDMRDALRRGDWLAFGRAFDALGRLLGVRAP